MIQLELFRVRSPLLTESLLVSFPALNYMLKFSAWSYLFEARKFLIRKNWKRKEKKKKY